MSNKFNELSSLANCEYKLKAASIAETAIDEINDLIDTGLIPEEIQVKLIAVMVLLSDITKGETDAE